MSEIDDEMMEEFETVILTDEDGCEIEFAVIDTVEDGGNAYVLAVEAGMLDEDEPEAALYKKTVSENGEDMYELIEDDDEFNKIAGLFQLSGDDYDVELEN